MIGIDVSSWQGTIDWEAVKKNVSFAIIRSSYGTGYRDKMFTRNRDEARRVGIGHGFYHYAYPNNNTPEAEANWFADVIGTPRENEILALDFEESYPDPVGWSKRFLDTLSKRLGGYKPMIYINLNLNNTQNWSLVVNSNYGLWLARWDYNSNAGAPATDWAFTAMRQYANNGRVGGISGNVDMNVFYGDISIFNKYGYHSKPQPVEDKMLYLYVKPGTKPAYSLGKDGKKHWYRSWETASASGDVKIVEKADLDNIPRGDDVALLPLDSEIIKTADKIKLEETIAKLQKNQAMTDEQKKAVQTIKDWFVNLWNSIFK